MKKFLLLSLLPALCLAVYDLKWFDLNNWRCPFYNDARYGIDVTNSPGGSWPYPLRNFYIFGAGPWVGALSSSETLVTVGYNPNTGGTEFHPSLCAYWRETPLDSADRVYKFPGDWPPPLSRFPMAPQESRAQMDLWASFGDSNPALHSSPGRPLGIDIYLTVYGFSDSIARDLIFLKYQLANRSGAVLNQVYFGMLVDADVGNYLDDMCGLILNRRFQVGNDTFRVRNTGFFYDYDNVEPQGNYWERGTPGAVALRLLGAPDGLGLTAFKRFTIEIDPTRDPEQYLTLKGYNYRTGEYEPYDSLDPQPGDKRALLGSGPFDLMPDSVATFWYAVIAAPYGDSAQLPAGRDTTQLALRAWWAELVWQRILAVEERPAGEVGNPARVYPNPWRSGAVLHLISPEAVLIYDHTGRLIGKVAGAGEKVWDGRDLKGRRVTPGVYFVRTGKAKPQKLIILQE